jgi:hypothetical protein
MRRGGRAADSPARRTKVAGNGAKKISRPRARASGERGGRRGPNSAISANFGTKSEFLLLRKTEVGHTRKRTVLPKWSRSMRLGTLSWRSCRATGPNLEGTPMRSMMGQCSRHASINVQWFSSGRERPTWAYQSALKSIKSIARWDL